MNEDVSDASASPEPKQDRSARLAGMLRDFVIETKSSPLYTALCPLLADTPVAIELLEGAARMQRRPNLLLAAIHASLFRDPSHQLAGWFPTVGGSNSPADPMLRSVLAGFLTDRFDELQSLVQAGSTQTNEPGRSAVLFPVLADIANRFDSDVAMIDVGSSAGLNLRFDHYSYTYKTAGGEVRMGDPSSPVNVVCDVAASTGALPFDAMKQLRVSHRCGLDLNPLDVHDEFQARWLQALVWPDEAMRCARLGAALELARAVPVDVEQGDAVDSITALVDAVPLGVHPVIVTTWVMTYLPADRRVAFADSLAKLGTTRPLTWVFMEHPYYARELPFPAESRAESKEGQPELGCPVVAIDYDGSGASARWLATTHGHGTWLRWH